jgi:ferredoxin-type protein NapG
VNWSRRDILFGAGLVAGAWAGGVARSHFLPSGRAPFRPPGALPEDEFLAACIRCGQCITACPFDTLKFAPDLAGAGTATPTLNPGETPCGLCHGYRELRCIATCPTDALSALASEREIRIGRARVDRETCLAYNGVVSRSCWHACPFPGEAIRLDGRLRPHVTGQCLGCGLCTAACPTETTSIPVLPLQAFQEARGSRRGRQRGDGK